MSEQETLVQKLSKHPFVSGLTRAHVTRLAEMCREQEVAAGSHLFKTGGVADKCYLILKGHVAIEIYESAHGATRIDSLGPGDVAGWSWLFPGSKWTFDGLAVDDVSVLVLDGASLLTGMESDHELGYQILKRLSNALASRIRSTRLRMLDMYGPSRAGGVK